MREPVGCDCDQDAGENAKQPKHGPKENELEHGVAARKAVYDTTEKDRLSERDKCNADVGQGARPRASARTEGALWPGDRRR